MASMHSTHAVDADDHDETVHHEDTDIDIRAVFVAAVALTVMAAFCYVAVWGTFTVLSNREDAASAVREYPLARDQEDRQPPEPRLQTAPKQDLRDLRADEQLRLQNYRWVDRTSGVVRIPIEDAMRLTLQRGLPARGPAAAPAAGAPASTAPASTPAPPAAPPAH